MVHALREASARLHVKWNGNPDGPSWRIDLFNARDDILFYLRQLEGMRAEAEAR